MLFLVNPAKKGGRVRKRGKLKGAAKTAFLRRMAAGRRKAAGGSTTHTGGTVAKRRRRRARARINPPKRRRRRRAVTVAARRAALAVRRHRRKYAANPRRRHARRYRRNPGLLGSARGVVGTLKQGVVDGGLVLAGEIIQNKAVATFDKFVPAFSATPTSTMQTVVRPAVLNLGVATAGSLVLRRFAPGKARMLTAGLFARAIANILANTPAAALLGDGVDYTSFDTNSIGYGAYPRFGAYPAGQVGAGGQGIGAYPSPSTADLGHQASDTMGMM